MYTRRQSVKAVLRATPGFKMRAQLWKLCVLGRWDLIFCLCHNPLQDHREKCRSFSGHHPNPQTPQHCWVSPQLAQRAHWPGSSPVLRPPFDKRVPLHTTPSPWPPCPSPWPPCPSLPRSPTSYNTPTPKLIKSWPTFYYSAYIHEALKPQQIVSTLSYIPQCIRIRNCMAHHLPWPPSLCGAHSHLAVDAFPLQHTRQRDCRHCGKGRCNKRAGGQLNSFTEAKTKSTPFTEAKTMLNTVHRGQDQAQLTSQRPRPATFTVAKTNNLHRGQDQEQDSSTTFAEAKTNNLFTEAKTQLNTLHRGQDPAQHPSQRPRPCSTPFTEAKTMLNKLLRGQD